MIIPIGVLIIIIACYAALQKQLKPELEIKSLKNAQDAYAPLGHPVNKEDPNSYPEFDPRLYITSAFDRVLIPEVDHVEFAIGSSHGAGSYDAQPFLTDNKRRGGKHLADDWNGIGGQNTDLGMPVYAAANGRVQYVGVVSPGWGRVVILAHRMEDGSIKQTMYAHLLKSQVYLGKLVGRGEKIGEVGNAGGSYLAHLHLEVRENPGVLMNHRVPGYFSGPMDRSSPTEWIEKNAHEEKDILYQSPLTQAFRTLRE